MTENSGPASTQPTLLSDWLDALSAAWAAAGPEPNVAEFLPDGPSAVRRMALVELVKVDIEWRLRRGRAKPLEEYLAAFAELAADLPADLLYEDLHQRRRAGLPADSADYYRRFPDRAGALRRLMDVGRTTRSTSLARRGPPDSAAPGERLDDFDLLAQLGRGQFARVYLAWQRSLKRQVALKVSADRGAEARTLARLDHPHIVKMFDQRRLPERGLLLVYMAYVAGGTLLGATALAHRAGRPRDGSALLAAVDVELTKRGERPPGRSRHRRRLARESWPAAVAAVGARLAEALDYAHRRDVLHRDVKPANVLLTPEGQPQLVDFNVGCCTKLEGAGPAAFFGGTLAYMAPEHLEAFNPEHPRAPDSLDGRCDLFGLGVTLWELLTGRRPFPDDPPPGGWLTALAAATANRRAGAAPEAVADLRAAAEAADVRGLADVLLATVAADPGGRPATGAELARALDLCRRPAAHELLHPPPGGWRGLIRRRPLAVLYPAALAANVVFATANVFYNQAAIDRDWPTARHAFDLAMLAINGALFPLAMLVFALYFRPVGRGLRGAAPAGGPARRHCLDLGTAVAVIGVVGFVAAGVAFPVGLRLAAGPPDGGPGVYLEFLASLVVCGLAAAAYPFFAVTFLSVRGLYPALVGPAGPPAADLPRLAALGRRLGAFRVVAAAVPLSGIAFLTLTALARDPALIALSVAGVAGFAFARWVEGHVRRDLAALAGAAGGTPPGNPAGE